MVKVYVNNQGKVVTLGNKPMKAPEGGSSGKYQLLQRISDDSNNENESGT